MRTLFGRTSVGIPVERFTLSTGGEVSVSILTLGGIIQSLRVPDREGRPADVVLGYDDVAGYEGDTAYLGAIVGRYANRIRNAAFQLDGTRYRLAANNGSSHLHGGLGGFDRALWSPQPFESADGVGVTLSYLSADGEEGYPGNLRVRVTYTLTPTNALTVRYRAETDRSTPLNLSQHSYFNLGGAGSGDVLGHEVLIHADRFLPIDADLIPSGELRPVEGTPLDFRLPTPIGARIDEHHHQLVTAGGYDHTFVLRADGSSLVPAARVVHPGSGRTLEVWTTEPGVQFYTGNFLSGQRGKKGAVYSGRTGFCLETQHFPDSPNQPAFPNTILRPGEIFESETRFVFATS